MVLEAVRKTIASHELIAPGDHVLVAVSGGVDSVVLLHALRALGPELGFTMTVAHLNHGWRTEASDEDETFVGHLASEAQLGFVSERLDEIEAAAHRGAGREGAAREVRRRFLLRSAQDVAANCIATGHTSNDRAETILYNLTRGAGTAGLSGIDPINEPFVRPLVDVSRSDVLAYAEAEGLTWREDVTNEDVSFDRNRIRHLVLPELEQINRKVIEAICRAGDRVANAGIAESLLVDRLWPAVVAYEETDDIHLRRDAVSDLPRAIQQLVLREALRRIRGDLQGIDSGHVDSLARLVSACQGHGDLHLPRAYVRVDEQAIAVSATPFIEAPAWEEPVGLGRTDVEGRSFAIDLQCVERATDTEYGDHGDCAVEAADADRIAYPLSVRSRRIGDRFTPLGMSQPVKLKDFLINARVPFFSRDDVPLLCDQEKIIWVVGVRLSNDVRITSDTKRLLVMRMELPS